MATAAVRLLEDCMTDRAGQPEPEVYPGQIALEAQNRFVSENLRRVFLLIYRIVGNVDDAQDLTQEVFIKALQRQEQLKDLDKAAHWLSRIATNTAIDLLRRHGRVNVCEIDEAVDPRASPTRTFPSTYRAVTTSLLATAAASGRSPRPTR